MSDKLIKLEEKLEEKLENIDKKLGSIDVTLARQEVNLEHHIKRTSLAEENIQMLREELKPIEAHVNTMNNVFKAIGVLATFLGFIAAILKAFF